MKSKILVIVEGPKTDTRLMSHLFDIYGISDNHEIVSYNTNIYTLYGQMFEDNDPESLDIKQVLKEREKDEQKRRILDDNYSDILLIFDLDPQAPDFSAEKIRKMLEYFIESSDMGKLYLNYPMVEAFYHMKSIPDSKYYDRKVLVSELKNYKTIVNQENRNHDYTKFAVSKDECNVVISQNIRKGHMLTDMSNDKSLPDSSSILNAELMIIANDAAVSVLSTCIYYIVEYNSKLIE